MSIALDFSPLPIVDLRSPSFPVEGFNVTVPAVCAKHYETGECLRHYQILPVEAAMNPEVPVLCPFGFTSIPFKVGPELLAITAVIPYPRMGGGQERQNAKRFAENKVSLLSAQRIIYGVKKAFTKLNEIADATVQRHSAALHEIRKLNAKIKQNAERLQQGGSNLRAAEVAEKTLAIFQASELMSKQFEVMEILANQNLAKLPPNTTIEPYKIFHKCMKVYEDTGAKTRVKLSATPGYYPRIQAFDKTFPIIATVLIQNAKKYAALSSEITIFVEPAGDQNCKVSVSNISEGQQLLDDSVMERGVRMSTDTDGSGNGLFVAQLVAKQHGTRIGVRSELINHLTVRNTFEVVFATVPGH